MSPRRPVRAAVVGAALTAVLTAALTGCSGTSCDELPALTAERDTARADFLVFAQDPSSDLEQVTASHDALHLLEQRVYDLEQGCTD